MQKIAIFGAGGQLGVELTAVFRQAGNEVSSFDRSRLDITSAEAVERALAEYHPAVVLNAAAYNQVDLAEKEPDLAFQVNALAVRNLAIACRQIDAKLVHFSTDYVFDGLAGRAYREEDPTHPLGAYAVSKLAGELYAGAYLDRPLIIRTSAVFGPVGMDTARGNFVETMLRLAGKNQPIRVVEDHVASPSYAPALARCALDLLARDVDGIVHVGGGTPISWFDWAAKIFRGRRPQAPARAHQRARVPHGGAPSQIFGPRQRASGGPGDRAYAVARPGDSVLYGHPRTPSGGPHLGQKRPEIQA